MATSHPRGMPRCVALVEDDVMGGGPPSQDTCAPARVGLAALDLGGGGIVPPFDPRAGVVPDLRIPEKPEHPVGHRGALARLAVRNDLFVRGDALARIQGLQGARIL